MVSQNPCERFLNHLDREINLKLGVPEKGSGDKIGYLHKCRKLLLFSKLSGKGCGEQRVTLQMMWGYSWKQRQHGIAERRHVRIAKGTNEIWCFKNSNIEVEYLSYDKGQVSGLWFLTHAAKEQTVVSAFRQTKILP